MRHPVRLLAPALAPLLLAPLLLAGCTLGPPAPDVNGTYEGTLARTSTCADRAMDGTKATVKIVSDAKEQTARISGPITCTITFEITDYGAVGSIRSVDDACTLRPEGFALDPFGGSSFAPKRLELAWARGGEDGGKKCVVNDVWTLR